VFFDSYLNLQIIAAVTPPNHKITFVDERIRNLKFDEKYDLVGITSTTGLSPRAYEIADKFRTLKVPVVLGGPHVSSLPDEAKQHADSVVIGEGELTWPQLLKDLEQGKLKPFYKQTQPIDPKMIPHARRDLARGFLPVARIQATRGCLYNCEFCAVPTIEKHILRKRPIEDVIDEIKHIRQKFLIFSDSSLTLDVEYSKDLFRSMKGLHKKFACFGNADALATDDELLRLAKKAGCHTWHVGFESTSQEIIDRLGKSTNNVTEYRNIVQRLHKNRMAISASFIVGFDEDTTDVFGQVLQAVTDMKIDLFEINILTPFPGTPLYKRYEREGRILTKDWYHYKEGQGGTKVVFQPKNMTPDELRDGIDRIFWEWLKAKNQLKISMRTIKYGSFPFIYTFFSSHFFL
jgi:radical SAM superfamily enzyme YgiQ (UPF0313 family)